MTKTPNKVNRLVDRNKAKKVFGKEIEKRYGQGSTGEVIHEITEKDLKGQHKLNREP